MGTPISAGKQTPLMGGLRSAIDHGLDILGFTPDPGEGEYPSSVSRPDPLDPDGRWVLGSTLQGDACGSVHMVDPCSNAQKPTTPSGLYVTEDLQPVAVRSYVACSSFGTGFAPDELVRGFVDKAKERLFACQWGEIAHELWTGEYAQAFGFPNKYLAMPFAPGENLTPGGGPADIVEALGVLEDALSHCSCSGPHVIHVPRKLIPRLADAGQLLQRDNSLLQTWNGSTVIADAGYPGSGPGSPATADTAWIYGTSGLSARIGEVVTTDPSSLVEAFRATTNDIEVHAERLVEIGWLCCRFGIQVKVC